MRVDDLAPEGETSMELEYDVARRLRRRIPDPMRRATSVKDEPMLSYSLTQGFDFAFENDHRRLVRMAVWGIPGACGQPRCV
jgi:hypothetical protein